VVKPKRSRIAAARKPKQERSRDTVDAILTAATRVFVREGYARATTNRIAKTAGVSVGSVYQYFPSKDAIATELLRRYRERLVARIAARVGEMNEVTFRDVVHTLVSALLIDEEIDVSLRRVLIERVLRTDRSREVSGFEERIEGLLADSETLVVYAQSPGEVARTGELLGLTDTEAELVVQLRRGMALWKVGQRSFLVEHRLASGEQWLTDTDHAMDSYAARPPR